MMMWNKGLTRGLAVAAVSVFTAVAASAQDEDAVDTDDATEASEDQDIITVRARGQRDDAMDAFRRGDFEAAEIEFQANARCALRRERNKDAAANSARIDSARAETSAAAQPSGSGANPGQAAGATQPSGVSGPGAADSIRDDGETPAGRTCENRGFQLYMMGLSQLQTGKTEDALENFERAVKLNKVLYDAHYRIALIALLDGDKKKAQRQLKQIERILRRCRDCEAREEIVQRRDHLTLALNDEVQLN